MSEHIINRKKDIVDPKDIIEIEIVKAFKAVDGKLFESEIEALNHSKDINFKQSIKNIVANESTSSILFNEAIYDFIITNKIKLKQIFERA